MTRHDEANARALKEALMRLELNPPSLPYGLVATDHHLEEHEAEAIVALAVQHLLHAQPKGSTE